jgi:asparagine synthase (glutamine-hydrolysing)
LLQLQFTTGRQTVFAGIERVLPGEVLVIKDGRITDRHHHKPLPAGDVRGLTEEDALTLLDEYLEESIDLHQRADVDYGMFLSGGIDSSAVLAMMSRLNVRPVQAFTAGFDSQSVHDERDQARRIAASVGADHEEVSFGKEDFWSLLPRVAAAMDDPVADYAILPTFKLAMTARDAGLKVILSGEGGDELFGGYGRYRSAMRWKIFGGRPMRKKGIFDGLGLLRDYPKNWRSGIADAEQTEGTIHRTRLQVAQAVDIADWLPNDLLTKLDRCLMANGIEGRVPFIDPVLADFAFRLSDNLKVKRRLGKWLLRKWLHSVLPEAEPFARKKGFTVPVSDWMAARGAQLGPLVAHSDAIAEICEPEAVIRLFASMDSKQQGQAAWSLLFYALWHRRHIQGLIPEGGIMDVLAP